MPAPLFDIVFRGVRAGFDAAQAREKFATLFKLDAAKAERVFKSSRVILKHSANERLANIFIARLFAIGVVADKRAIEPIISKAIFAADAGATCTDAHAMHQPIDAVYGEHIRRIPFEFSGTGIEYCKIWLVNVLVSVLSAGILQPWAQVRSLRYFYLHTHLDNAEFRCRFNPQKIFLVQFLLVAYVAALAYSFFHAPYYCVAGIIILVCGLPFYWFKRSLLIHRHSFYCDTRFQQAPNLRDTYIALLAWPLAAVLSAGIAAPFAAYKIQQYRSQTTALGGYAFSFSANVKNYFALLPSLLTAEIITFACAYYREHIPLVFSLLLVIGVWLWMFVGWRVALVNLQWNAVNTKLGHFVATWDLASYKKLVIGNLALCLLTMGFYWPWAKVRTAEYKAAHLAFFANQRFKKWKSKLIEVD